ncbi:uncharacterized protein LOC111072280 [Drosophila obscura]|uniref:uncharacterized protein LOC111072280 n=1 Tax=Drosophila obscura TaxID=7282 RepID=UPI000BA0E120|nr:uncharacterized protein LOC111072280 [Drosophila obscura]
MLVQRLVPIFVGFTALTALSESVLARKMIFKTVGSRYNPKVFSNFTVQIINSKLKVDTGIISPLRQGVKTHLDFEFRLSKDRPYQIIFQNDINFCALIKGGRESLYRRWFKSMLKLGNFSTNCPIRRGYYYLHGWSPDGSQVPSFFLKGDYRISATLFYGSFKANDENPLLDIFIEAVLNQV